MNMNPFTSSDLTAPGGSLNMDTWDARRTADNKVSVVDVIADVRRVKHDYAAQLYRRLLSEERVPHCEVRPLPPGMSVQNPLTLRGGLGGSREPPNTPRWPQPPRWLKSFGSCLAQQSFAGTAPKQLFAIWAGMKRW